MIINGVEYRGSLSCDGSMHVELTLESTEGLSVGQHLTIEDEGTTYFHRDISSINDGLVVCDASATAEELEEALGRLGVE